MQDQWYLDLDGVRSGPYQTSEVMNLIAGGEVLPTHLISKELKGGDWITILNWRLSQSQPQSTEPPEPKPEAPKKIEIESEKPRPAPPQKISPVENAKVNAPDPAMALFDVIQTTKQKREARSQSQAQQASVNAEASSPAAASTKKGGGSGWMKTLAIAGGVTAIGFALGQYFQQSSRETSKEEPAAKSTPTATPTSTPKPTPKPAEKVIDRSTEKITIKKRDSINAAVQAATPLPTPIPPPPMNAPEDLQELRNLKKELQELRELKKGRNSDEYFDETGDGGEGNVNEPAPADPEVAPEAEKTCIINIKVSVRFHFTRSEIRL